MFQILKSSDLSIKDFKQAIEEKVSKVDSSNCFEIISELTEILDLYLQKKWTDKIQPSKKEIILENLKKLTGKRGQGNIVMAQINPISGNIEENAKKIMAYIKSAEKTAADTIIFSELALMGYPIHDTIDRHPVIVEENVKWLKEIAKQTSQTHAIVGFVEPRETEKIGKKYYNATALLGDGKILGITRKSLLPTYSEFNDYRYFEPSPVVGNQPPETLGHFGSEKITKTSKLSKIHGHNYGVTICEDGWSDKDFFKRGVLYECDTVE